MEKIHRKRSWKKPYGFFRHFGKVRFMSGISYMVGHSSSFGVPSFWKILKIVSISESPAKSGWPHLG